MDKSHKTKRTRTMNDKKADEQTKVLQRERSTAKNISRQKTDNQEERQKRMES